ncbi:MAG: GDYXXLXY domain-containing protein [Hyphomonadaceae bacterium]
MRARTIAFLGVLTAALIGMAACEHIARRTGAEIVLRTRPVDPRDIVRGAYVQLDYEIERVHLPDLPTAADPSDWRPEDTLWLTLRPSGAVWIPVAISAQRPALTSGAATLRARYIRREDYAAETPAGKNMPVDILLDIGADHYYAAEDEAKKLEARARRDPIDVVLALDRGGKPVIKGLIVDGVRKDETLF